MRTVFVKARGLRVQWPAPLNAAVDLTGVGSESFVEETRKKLGVRAKGRKIRKRADAYQLREPHVSYSDTFCPNNNVLSSENRYFWNIYQQILNGQLGSTPNQDDAFMPPLERKENRGNRFSVRESGVTQASRRILIKQKIEKKFDKIITNMVKKLSLSNVQVWPHFLVKCRFFVEHR